MSASPNAPPERPVDWAWAQGQVQSDGEHLELRHADSPEDPAALIGPASGGVFPVQLLVRDPAMLRDVRKQLDLYLVELNERDPWAYAIYHCGTMSNAASNVHWSYHR